MENDGDLGMVIEDRRHVVVGLASVYDCGLTGGPRDSQLSLEGYTLGRTRSVVVVIIQAGFTDCHHAGITRHAAEPLVGGGVPLAGGVRMDARSRGETRLGARHLHSPVRG